MLQCLIGRTSHSLNSKCRYLCWKNLQMMYVQSNQKVPTAGIIVIGDEILKGQVRDTNSHFILSRLYNIGVQVMKVSVIGDDVDEISNEVRKFSRLYTFVITSGGIGPTHDDVTYEGVAKAFEEDTFPHPELVKICLNFYKTTDLSAPAMKLASVPKSSKLTYGFDPILKCKLKYPNISVRNVYIFPGVPPLLEKSFEALCEELFGGTGSKFFKTDVYINDSEVSIAEYLSRAAKEFPSVAFGSYPQFGNSYYQIKLTVEANNPQLLHSAVNRLKALLPSSCIVDFDSEPLQSTYEKVRSLSLQSDMSHVKASLQNMLQTLSAQRSTESLLFFDASLRGLATLHLLHAARDKLQIKDPMLAFAIMDTAYSDAYNQYIKETFCKYSLQLEGQPNSLKELLSTVRSMFPNLETLIAGCECSISELQNYLDSCYGKGAVTLLSSTVAWNDAQVLEFVKKLNLTHFQGMNA